MFQKTHREMINRSGLLSLLWATLQQMVVASSTYFIIIASRLGAEKDFNGALKYIAAFAVSLLVVFLPNTLSLIYLQKWRLESFEKFVNSFTAVNFGKTTWSHNRDKTVHESWLTNEALNVYDNATNLLYQFFSTLLSFVLNIAVIAVILDWRILGWYLGACLVLFVFNRVFQKTIAAAALGAQAARNTLNNTMLTAWENIFIGNRYNIERWHADLNVNLDGSRRAIVHYDLVRSLISSVTVSLAIVLIAAGNAIYLFQYRDDMPMIAALMITFPRQLQTVQNIFAFFNLCLSWSGISHQLSQLNDFLSMSQTPRNPERFVQFANISIAHGNESFKSTAAAELIQRLEESTCGRFTLRGRNGMGKSTLLALIAEGTGDRSFFLPSKFGELAFRHLDTVQESDGNRLLAVFEEIRSINGVKFVLLDEWDANLDAENIRLIDEQINLLSKTVTVIESRHRGS